MHFNETMAYVRRLGYFALLIGLTVLPAAAQTAPLKQVLLELRVYAAAQLEESQVPGFAYAVVKGDQIVDAQAFGVKDTLSGEPVDLETMFEIGSCSKAFTAALMALAVEEGKVSWQDSVRKYLPDFTMNNAFTNRQIQLADLMSQRMGLPGYALIGAGILDFPASQLVRALRYVKPVASFRSSFAYQNVPFEAVRFILEKVYKMSYAELLQSKILNPLGMTRTTAVPYADGAANMARGNVVRNDGSLYPVPDEWAFRNFIIEHVAAGGIHSTVLDLAKWIQLQLNRGVYNGQRVISEEGILSNWTPKIQVQLKDDTTNLAYANGWIFQTNVPAPVIWHNGSTLSMHSIVGFIPVAGLGIAVTTNTDSNLVPENLLWKLYHLYYAPQLGVDQAFTVANSMPLLDARPPRIATLSSSTRSQTAERLVGLYRNPAYGAMRVQKRGGQLYMTLGPKRMRGQLTRKEGTVFSLTMPQWAGEFSEVEFLGRGTHPRAVRVAALDEAGIFRRRK